MLPFEWREMRRYGASPRFIKLLLLHLTQSSTFRRASGVIFLSDYAKRRVSAIVGPGLKDSRVIAHGIDPRFAEGARRNAESLRADSRIHLLYVSSVDVYKHQWRVIEAVAILQQWGWNVDLTLIGPVSPDAARRFQASLDSFAGVRGSVRYLGPVDHSELRRHYFDADIFVYASSCENLPNILLEAMASGLAIASSSRGPMPEILKDGGVYFDPESAADVAAAVRRLIESPMLMVEAGRRAASYSESYSWKRCAESTLGYLADVARRHQHMRAQAG
jgi:glycosyltransferase involved in cell wall biosynthesis